MLSLLYHINTSLEHGTVVVKMYKAMEIGEEETAQALLQALKEEMVSKLYKTIWSI